MKKKGIVIFVLLGFIIGVVASLPGSYSVPDKPPQGYSNGSDISHVGKTEISEDSTLEEKSYSSTTGDENAILINNATVSMNSCEVNKSGDSDGDSADFYGINAGVLAYNKALVTIKDSKIETSGSHANAVFAYDTGVINISKSSIKTTKNNSGGIMVTGGGVINASELSVETDGNSSASIRSDRGGGSIKVEGGKYTTNGVGSPTIYSTADIEVKNATLVSNKSEGVVVEGKNRVFLDSCTLEDHNTTLNGNSETYKNIFLYQSMSGDADTGLSSFEANNSMITTYNGDTFYVTNTTAKISLQNNTLVNMDGDFLRIEAAKWGKSGSNGGDVTLDLKNQVIEGNIIVDDISTLDMYLKEGSSYTGIINQENRAKELKLILSKNSKLVLTGDSYVTSLENEDESNANIDFNGYKLYVGSQEIDVQETKEEEKKVEESTKEDNKEIIKYVVIFISIVLFIVIIICMVIKKTKRTI